ncbi:HEAT repeat domain-containing protein [Actinoplanes aureus]|uniref:HEAT repeat domain-containing protein n=1 Tax=Actinoplanes aureus TaxID=2792083 RepID=A0A931C5R4_9ACTN|nr:HEAT repeat domain-containing protein [Actinoplanes aureus]MBG0559953.1 HEAT repeat domain-containing protein [Actinoplanes aureus]
MTEAYISATFEDLRECRQAVRSALELFGLPFRTMEKYSAGKSTPLARCLADVESCDIYIGIFAWQYGDTPPNQSKSFTHLEYEHAVARGKDCLIFLHNQDAPWPVRFVDRGPKSVHVDALRKVLQTQHLCDFFDSPSDLALLVYGAVHKLLEERAREETPVPAVAQVAGLSPAATEHYFERLRQQYGGLDLLNLSPQQYLGTQLLDVFVEPRARDDQPPPALDPSPRGAADAKRYDRSALPKSWPGQPVLDVVCDRQRLVLIGDPGAGKSAVVRYLALRLARAHADERLAVLADHLPILVELRSYAGAVAAGQCRNFREYLAYRAATDGYEEEPDGLRLHLARGDPAVVIFDGLDEIFDRRIREETAGQIAAFAESFPNARVVVTTRPAEYNRVALAAAGFAHYTLQRFAPEQAADFLGRWFQAVSETDATVRREVVLGTIRRSPELTELAGNPMLLSILAVLGRHRMLPKQRWRLYKEAAVTLVHSWDDSRMVNTDAGSQLLDADEKHNLLRSLAFDMMSGRLGPHGDHVSGDELRQIFAQHLVRQGSSWTEAKASAKQTIEQLQKRSFVLGRAGRADYRFVHRTFLEFYCAWAIVERFKRHEAREEIKSLFRDRWADPGWRETLRLVAGQVSVPLAAELVELLVTEINPDWHRDPPPDPPWNVVLAVQCLAGIHPIEDAGPAAGLVLRQVSLVLEHCARTPAESRSAYSDLLVDELIPAVEAVGSSWPESETYLDWYRRVGVRIVSDQLSASTSRAIDTAALAETPAVSAARIAAILAKPGERLVETFESQLDDAADVRILCAAVAGLGELAQQAVRHEATERGRPALEPLLRIARGAEQAVVRLASVQALAPLAAVYPESRDVLFEAASTDAFSTVRLSAVQILGERLSGEPGVVEVLLHSLRNDHHAVVRAGVVRVLARSRQLSGEVVEALMEACRRDPASEVVEAAAGVLLPRAETDGEAREVLLARMGSDPVAGVRRTAVGLLGRSGSEGALLERIRDDTHGLVVRDAAVALAARGQRPRERSWEALRARLAAEPDEVMRRAVVRTLSSAYGSHPRLEAALTTAARDTEPSVRLAAVQGLADLPETTSRRRLLVRVAGTDATPSVRQAAVEALGSDRDETVTKALVEVAENDRDTEIRTAALRGLCGRPLDAATGGALVPLTGDGHHPQIRLAALQVLIGFCPAGVDLAGVLLDRISHDSVGEVFAAAAAAAVGDTTTAAPLWTVIAERATSDPKPEIRAAAVGLLGSGADPKTAAEVFRDRVRRDADPSVVAAAAAAAADLQEDDLRDELLARLSSGEPAIRQVVIRALAGWLTDDTVRREVLTQARDAEQHEVRRAAVEILEPVAHLGDVQDVLITCTADEDFAVSSTAQNLLRLNDRWREPNR